MNLAKRLVVAVLALSMFAGPARAEWIAAVTTNPANGTVLLEAIATSDQVSVSACIDGGASVPMLVRFQHRDAANTGTVKEQYLPLNVTGLTHVCFNDAGFNLLSGERVRIVSVGVVVGTVSVSLQHGIY